MPDEFDKVLNEAIEDEVSPPEPTGPYTDLRGLLMQMKDAQQNVNDLQTQIDHLIEQLTSSLGLEIRKRHPQIAVSFKGGKCQAGHPRFGKHVSLRPDLENEEWSADGPLSDKVRSEFGHVLKMSDDIIPLAHALADAMKKEYKRW
jgi:hypothetical protein